MPLLRTLIGDALRRERLGQARTLRDVSRTARVSLGYLSEVERGQKEASSELLAAICAALDVRLADVLREVSDDLAVVEPLPVRPVAPVPATVPVTALPAGSVVGGDGASALAPVEGEGTVVGLPVPAGTVVDRAA